MKLLTSLGCTPWSSHLVRVLSSNARESTTDKNDRRQTAGQTRPAEIEVKGCSQTLTRSHECFIGITNNNTRIAYTAYPKIQTSSSSNHHLFLCTLHFSLSTTLTDLKHQRCLLSTNSNSMNSTLYISKANLRSVSNSAGTISRILACRHT